jgi:5-formyltetrahydrofolate cyclo-ligase
VTVTATNNNADKKQLLRVQYRQRAAEVFSNPKVSQNIIKNLKVVLPQQATVASFRSKSDEPQLDNLFEIGDVRLVYPRIEGDSLSFYMTNDLDSFELNSYGIHEPIPAKSKKIEIQNIDMVLVPAIAFDRKCNRLGRGKGFYDRALERFSGLKIGIAAKEQILNEDLPRDEHDVTMNMVVTDQFILRRFDT